MWCKNKLYYKIRKTNSHETIPVSIYLLLFYHQTILSLSDFHSHFQPLTVMGSTASKWFPSKRGSFSWNLCLERGDWPTEFVEQLVLLKWRVDRQRGCCGVAHVSQSPCHPLGDVFWWLAGQQLGLAFRLKFLGQPQKHWIQLIFTTSPVSLDTNLMPIPCYKLTLIDTNPPPHLTTLPSLFCLATELQSLCAAPGVLS